MIGQERAVATLVAGLTSGRPAHAYLFVGPPNVGKQRLALQLAQALNCQREERPCQECDQCRRVARGLHADVQTVTVGVGESGPHKKIQIAQIREIERAVALRPFEGRTRVVIIDLAEAMNVEAENAFLKTLEEPPPDVVFVLVTAEAEALLPTIRSRCRPVQFGLLALAGVEAALKERLGVADQKARSLARLSQGRIGLAMTLATEEASLAAHEEAADVARSLPQQSIGERFELASKLAGSFGRERKATLETLDLWRQWWRDILLCQSGASEGVDNLNHLQALTEEASRYRRQEVAAFLRSIGAAKRHLEDNVNPRLALEALMLAVPRPTGTRLARRPAPVRT